MMQNYWEQLNQAAEVAKERQQSYSDVKSNFDKIQEILKAMFGIEMSREDICKVFIATKVAREQHSHKDDNMIDLINYIAILNFFIESADMQLSSLKQS